MVALVCVLALDGLGIRQLYKHVPVYFHHAVPLACGVAIMENTNRHRKHDAVLFVPFVPFLQQDLATLYP